MDELIIYKDQAKNIITAAIEKSTNKPPTEIIQIVADYADGVKALSSIPLDDKVQLLTNEENTKRAINKQLDDIPWFWRNDNGLLYYICVRLGVWLYQDFQHKQLDKKARAIMVENAITTILSDITLDEWKAIINSANTNPDLYYFYVRDHINKPILTAEQIKNNIQRFLIGRGVDGNFTDIDKAFSQDFDKIAIVLNCFNKSGYGNAIAYCDDDGEVQRFIYFYKKKYDDNDYYNVYYPNGKVEIYKNNSLYKTEKHIFNRVPAHVISVEDSETLYAKIKELNDDYNELLTNQQCLINEYRNAYLGICANKQDVDEEFIKKLKLDEAGVIVYPDPQAKPSWIIKQINDTAIKNQMDEIKQNLYAQSGHIDWNEKLSSNLSGVALQSRLTGLDQRVNMMLNPIKNALYSRIYFLCDCLALVNQNFDPADIKIEANIDIPTDTSARVNEVVQLGDIVSQQTKLERLPYVENPAIEIERIQKEKLQNAELQAKANKTAQNINLDLINE